MAREDGHNQVTFAGVVDGRPLYREGDGNSDAQLSFSVRSEIDKDDGRAAGVKSRQEVQLWGQAAEDWHALAAGTAVEVTGRLKTWKDTRAVKRLAIAVEAAGDIREAQGGDANEVDIAGEVCDRRCYPPRPGGKLAFFAATLHVMTQVDGRDLNASIPVRVFGRPAEDIADSAGEGAVLRVRRGVLKHERRAGRDDAEPSFQAVVVVDDHLGAVEVIRAVPPDDRSRGGRRDDCGGRRSSSGGGGQRAGR